MAMALRSNTDFQPQYPSDSSTLDVNPAEEKEPYHIIGRISKNFSTVWFTVCMDTGVLSIILHQWPYPSHWTRVCSTLMFVLNLVLYLIFATIYAFRWTYYRKATFTKTSSDAEEIALQAAPVITWMTITMQVQLTCAQSWGYAFTVIAYVMWCIAVVWIGTICVLLYLHLIKRHNGDIVDKWLPTAVFIPVVGMFTAANAAGVIVNGATNSTHMSHELAVPMIVLGFILVGFGLGLGIVMYAVYMHRLMTSGFPESLKIPAMILTIGPCGQSATALINLGNATLAHSDFAKYDRGSFLTATSAPVVRTICTLAAMLLLGFALFWMIVDYYALISGLVRRQIKPSLFWWSSIFPVGTVVTALSGLGGELDSVTFKVCAIILFVVLLIIYIVNTIFTIPMTLNGKLLGFEHGFEHGFQHEHHRLRKWKQENNDEAKQVEKEL